MHEERIAVEPLDRSTRAEPATDAAVWGHALLALRGSQHTRVHGEVAPKSMTGGPWVCREK